MAEKTTRGYLLSEKEKETLEKSLNLILSVFLVSYDYFMGGQHLRSEVEDLLERVYELLKVFQSPGDSDIDIKEEIYDYHCRTSSEGDWMQDLLPFGMVRSLLRVLNGEAPLAEEISTIRMCALMSAYAAKEAVATTSGAIDDGLGDLL